MTVDSCGYIWACLGVSKQNQGKFRAETQIFGGADVNTMADRLAELRVTASSPDGRFGMVHDERTGLELRFHDGGYRDYTERGLEPQLSRTLGRLRAAYWREFDAALAAALGGPFERVTVEADSQRRRFQTERDATVAKGMSTEGYVYVRHTCGSDWHAVVRDGALARLDEQRFGAEVASAYRASWLDFDEKSAVLRAKHFDTRVVNSAR